jgi:hypothetical protein
MKRLLFLGVILVVMGACMAGTTLGSRQRFVAAFPEMRSEVKSAILAGEVCMGMTEDQVIASIGQPNRITRDTSPFGTSTQFGYFETGNKYGYVYFEDGKVTSWITSWSQ